MYHANFGAPGPPGRSIQSSSPPYRPTTHAHVSCLPGLGVLGLSGNFQDLVGEPRQYCMASTRSYVVPIVWPGELHDVSWRGPRKHSIGG